MEKLLKKDHHRFITQFNAIQPIESTTLHIHPEMQQVLDRHQQPKLGKPSSACRPDLAIALESQIICQTVQVLFWCGRSQVFGHIVDREGVRVDLKKIQVMQDWPQPKTLKILRGFLGLTRYYRKFVCNYGHISRPLTNLIKKNSVLWTDAAQRAFVALKQTMCSTPILALPEFTKYFVTKCDASGIGIGDVLMQEGRPLAFTSQKPSGKHLGQSTYEKEMMSILHAVDTWKPYLLG
eukprot:PITA_24738